MGMSARSGGLLLLILLAACGGPSIRVSYPAPQNPADEALARTLSQVYVLFQSQDDDEDLGVFAARLDKALAARGGSVLAYRTSSLAEDSFSSSLAPSAILNVSLTHGPVLRSDFERGDSTRTFHTRISRRLDMTLLLASQEPGGLHVERTLGVEHATEHSREQASKLTDAAWLRENSEKLLKAGAARAGAALPLPRSIERRRSLHVDDKDAISQEASEKAQRGAWEEASGLWAQRLEEGRGGWRDLANLALAAEARRAFPEAQRLYQKAREAAGPDPEAAKVVWDEILSDLASGARLVARSEAAASWFSLPVAVLPFSDETTSVDGPENLRRMTAEALSQGGYAVLPADEVDLNMRRHGFSQGGQLSKGQPGDFARWTGAKRLVFGHIAEFRNVMLGFIGRREVSGDFRFWDADAGRDLYAATATAVTLDGTLDGGKAAGRFLGQLGVALLENWTGKPLGPESALWVVRSLRGIPLRPKQER